MATKLKVNYEFVGDSTTPVTRTESIKHGDSMLNTVINAAAATVNTKADKTYVDTELAKKANAADVTTALSGKADNTTVSALDSRLGTAETNIATQTARIDEIASLPEGSTTGDAELIDIRVGADGKTYTSAGNAVRGQVSDVKSDVTQLNGYIINNIVNPIGNLIDKKFIVDNKYIDENGEIQELNNMCYTSNHNPIEPNKTYSVLRASWVVFYDKNYNYISGTIVNQGGFGSTITTPEDCRYFIISCWKHLMADNIVWEGDSPRSQSYKVELNPNVEVPSEIIKGDLPEEVADARVGANGSTYTNVGTAIRTQVDDLNTNICDINRFLNSHLYEPVGNLIDKQSIVNGGYIDVNGVIWNDQPSLCYTKNYNPITSGKKYNVQESSWVVFYDKNYTYISGTLVGQGGAGWTITAPDDAMFFRISCRTDRMPINSVFEETYTNSYLLKLSGDVSVNWENIKNSPVNIIYANPNNLIEVLINNQGKTIQCIDGVYNVIDMYKSYLGNDYFDNYVDYTSGGNNIGAGLPLFNGTKLICSPNAVFTCHYDGSNANVTRNFSAFACGNGFEIDGLNIESSGIRYAIHDDFNDTNKGFHVNVKNSHIVCDNQAIGGGMGVNGVYLYENNYIEATAMWYDMRYHNNIASAKNKLSFVGNYFAQMPRIANYGVSAKHTTECFFSNNCMKNDIVHNNESEDYTIENIKVYEWNTSKHS